MIWLARNFRRAALPREHFRDDRHIDAGYFDPDDNGPDLDFDWSDHPASGSPGWTWAFDHEIDGGQPPRGLPGPSGPD